MIGWCAKAKAIFHCCSEAANRGRKGGGFRGSHHPVHCDPSKTDIHLRGNNEIVLDCTNSGSRPSSPFGLLALCPERDFAMQGDSVLYDAHCDVVRIYFSSPPQGMVDLRFDFR